MLFRSDHSAHMSKKSKANFEKCCELQDALIIDFSNAHCGHSLLVVATFVRGLAEYLSLRYSNALQGFVVASSYMVSVATPC